MRITNMVGRFLAMPTPGSEPAAPAGSADISSSGASNWLQDNVLGIVLLIIGILILFRSKEGNFSKVFVMLGIALVGLAVVAIAVTQGAGVNVGKWVAGLVGIHF